jgi:hypothetical protein
MLAYRRFIKGKGYFTTGLIAKTVEVYRALTLISIFLLREPNRKTEHLFSNRYNINNHRNALVV